MRRRVVVAVTSLMLVAKLSSTISAAQPSPEELGTIAPYINENDVQGLRDYLKLHPQLTPGQFQPRRAAPPIPGRIGRPNDFFKFDRNPSNSLGQPSAGGAGPSAY